MTLGSSKPPETKCQTFQELISRLSEFWSKHALIIPGYDMEMGTATLHPFTLKCLGKEKVNLAYVQRCRRPKDCRGGASSHRLGHYYQLQVLLKPSPDNMRELYEKSLEYIGFDLKKEYLKFICDDWASPTLGAAGVGWEIWLNGSEISQFTYFQKVCSQPVSSVSGEITYGLERIALLLQGKSSVYHLKWNNNTTYGDLFKREERETFKYYSAAADPLQMLAEIDKILDESKKLCHDKLPLPAYDLTIKATHLFNILDARDLVSHVVRGETIKKIRHTTKECGKIWMEQMELDAAK